MLPHPRPFAAGYEKWTSPARSPPARARAPSLANSLFVNGGNAARSRARIGQEGQETAPKAKGPKEYGLEKSGSAFQCL